eukprot:1137446-Pelagomonas_calceolata.AAC.5
MPAQKERPEIRRLWGAREKGVEHELEALLCKTRQVWERLGKPPKAQIASHHHARIHVDERNDSAAKNKPNTKGWYSAAPYKQFQEIMDESGMHAISDSQHDGTVHCRIACWAACLFCVVRLTPSVLP